MCAVLTFQTTYWLLMVNVISINTLRMSVSGDVRKPHIDLTDHILWNESKPCKTFKSTKTKWPPPNLFTPERYPCRSRRCHRLFILTAGDFCDSTMLEHVISQCWRSIWLQICARAPLNQPIVQRVSSISFTLTKNGFYSMRRACSVLLQF